MEQTSSDHSHRRRRGGDDEGTQGGGEQATDGHMHAAPASSYSADAALSPSAASMQLQQQQSPPSRLRPVHARRNSRTGAAVGAILSSSQTFSQAQLEAIHEPEADATTESSSSGSSIGGSNASAAASSSGRRPMPQLPHVRPPPITASLLPSATAGLGRRRDSIGSGGGSAGFSGSGGPGSSGSLDQQQPLSASATLSSSMPRSHASRLLNSQRHVAAPPALPHPAAALSVSITSSHAGALSLRSPKGSSGGSGGSRGSRGSGGSSGSGRGSGNTPGAAAGPNSATIQRGSGDRLRAGSFGGAGSGSGGGAAPGSAGGSARSSGSGGGGGGGDRGSGGGVGGARGSGSSVSSGSHSSSSESSARSSTSSIHNAPMLLQPLSLNLTSGSATPLSAKMIASPAHAHGSGSGSGSALGFPSSASSSGSFVLPRSPSASGSGVLISPLQTTSVAAPASASATTGMNSLRLGPAGSSGPLPSSHNLSLSQRSRSQSKETAKPILQSGQHVSLTASSVASPRTSLPLAQPSDPLSIALARMHTSGPQLHSAAALHDAVSSPDSSSGVISPAYSAGGSGVFSPAASAALHSPSPARRISVASLSPSHMQGGGGGGIGALLRAAPIAITATSGGSAFHSQHQQHSQQQYPPQVASPSSAFIERMSGAGVGGRSSFPTSSSYSSGLSSFHPHHMHGAASAAAASASASTAQAHVAAAQGGLAFRAAAVAIPAAAASSSVSSSGPLSPTFIRPGSFPRTAALTVLPPLTPSSHPMTPGPQHQPPEFDLELDAVPRAQQPLYYNQQRVCAATMGSTEGLQVFQAQHAASTAAAAAAAAAHAQAQARELPPPHLMTSLPRIHGGSGSSGIPPLAAVAVSAATVAVSATSTSAAASVSASTEMLLFSSDPAVGVGLLMTDKLRARQWGPLVLSDSDDVLAPSSIDPRDLAQAQDLHPIAVLPLPLQKEQPALDSSPDSDSLDVRSPRLDAGAIAGDGLDSLLDLSAAAAAAAAEESSLDLRSPRPVKDAAAASAAASAALGLLDPHVYLSARAYTAHALPPDPPGVAAVAAVAAAAAHTTLPAHRTVPSMDLDDLSSAAAVTGSTGAGVALRAQQKQPLHAAHHSIDTAQKLPAVVGFTAIGAVQTSSPSASPSASPSSHPSRHRSGSGSGHGSGRSHESHSSVDSTIEALNVGPPLLNHLRPLAAPVGAQHYRSHTLAAPPHSGNNGGGSGFASFRLDEGMMAFTPTARSAAGAGGGGAHSSVDVTPRADGSGSGSGSGGSGSRGASALSARVKTPSGLALALAAVVASDVAPLSSASLSLSNSTPSPTGYPPPYPRGRACSCTPPHTATAASAGSSGGRLVGSSADSPGTAAAAAACCPLHGGRPGSSGGSDPFDPLGLHSPVGARSLSGKPVRALAPLSQPTSPLPLRADADSPSSPVPALAMGSAAGGAGFIGGARVAHLSPASGHQPARRPSLRSNIIPQPLSPGPQLR